jgi:hypothetical protein
VTTRELGIIAIVLLMTLVVIWYIGYFGVETVEATVVTVTSTIIPLETVGITGSIIPVEEIQISDVEFTLDATANVRTVSLEQVRQRYTVRAVSADKLADLGASIEFTKTITIRNETGDIVFQESLEFTKGEDLAIEIFVSKDELPVGTVATIDVAIHMRLTLPTPVGVPTPKVVERTIEKSLTVPVEAM